MKLNYIEEQVNMYSEDIHSGYLFYTMALDTCLKRLHEIKELAETHCQACKEFEPEKCTQTNHCYCQYSKILNIIDGE